MIPDQINDIAMRAMSRLRLDGWEKILGVHPDGRTYTVTLKDGEAQPDDAYDRAFLDAYRAEHRTEAQPAVERRSPIRLPMW